MILADSGINPFFSWPRKSGHCRLKPLIAKETRGTVTSLRKSSRLLFSGVKRIAVRTKRQSSRGRGNAPTFALKGNRPHRQRRVASGESLLDLCRKVYFLHRRNLLFIFIIAYIYHYNSFLKELFFGKRHPTKQGPKARSQKGKKIILGLGKLEMVDNGFPLQPFHINGAVPSLVGRA